MPTPLRRAVTAACAAAACVAALAGCGALETNTTASTPSAASLDQPPTASATPVTFPLTVSAGNGSVTVKSRPARIVSLDATATEDLFSVGAGSQVVAVDQGSTYPANAPRTSLSGQAPDLNKIASYKPSLVIAAQDNSGLVAGLTQRGIPVLIEPPVPTLAAVYAQVEQIADVTGHQSQGVSEVDSMQKQLTSALAEAATGPGVTNGVGSATYYWESSASGNSYLTTMPNTLLGQIFSLFGLTDITVNVDKAATTASVAPPQPNASGQVQLTGTQISHANPQLIFVSDTANIESVLGRVGWSQISAVANRQVHILSGEDASSWGTLIPALAETIAYDVHHEEVAPTPPVSATP